MRLLEYSVLVRIQPVYWMYLVVPQSTSLFFQFHILVGFQAYLLFSTYFPRSPCIWPLILFARSCSLSFCEKGVREWSRLEIAYQGVHNHKWSIV